MADDRDPVDGAVDLAALDVLASARVDVDAGIVDHPSLQLLISRSWPIVAAWPSEPNNGFFPAAR